MAKGMSRYRKKVAERETDRPVGRLGGSDPLAGNGLAAISALYFQKRIGRGPETAYQVESILAGILRSDTELTTEWLHGAVATFSGWGLENLREHLSNMKREYFRYRRY